MKPGMFRWKMVLQGRGRREEGGREDEREEREGSGGKNTTNSLVVLPLLRQHNEVVACLRSFVAMQPGETRPNEGQSNLARRRTRRFSPLLFSDLPARAGLEDSLVVQRSHVRIDPQESLLLDTILLLSRSCDLVEHELLLVDEGSFRFGFEVLGGRGERSSGSSGGVGSGVI